MADVPVGNDGITGPGSPGEEIGDRKLRAELGINLLKEIEEEICGPHVSELPEVAEGLSLTTDRTAVICLKEDVPSRRLLSGVYHFQIPRKWSSFYRDSIMLAPVSFQEAVDLCLASHTLSDWTRRPVVCLHREVFAHSYGKVLFPSREILAATAMVEQGEKTRLMPEAIMQELDKLKELTGGDIGSVRLEGKADAPIAVIIPGLAPPRVRKLLASREDIKVILVTLLNPFPLDRIMDLVGNAEEVVLMLPRKNPFYKRLFSNLKYYLGDRFRREVWTEKKNGIKRSLIPPLLEATAAAHGLGEESFNLGISSSGEGATRILQEFAAACPVCRDGEFNITTVERCDLTVLTSGISRGIADCSGQLDLLIVDLTEGKRAEPGLRQLASGGHLVLIGDINRVEGLAEDATLLKSLRKSRNWKIWSGSEKTDWADLVQALSGLIFNPPSNGQEKESWGILTRIKGEALEEKIKERRQEVSRVSGFLRFPEKVKASEASENWPGIIREFFLTGSCPEDIYSRIDFSSPARPAVLHNLERNEVFETGFPLVAIRNNGTTDFRPICDIIGDNVDPRHLNGLIRAFASALEERVRAVCEFDDELVKRSLEIFSDRTNIDQETLSEVEKGTAAAFSGLSDSARALTFSRAVLPVICQSIASEKRSEKQRIFREEVSMLSGQLGDLLQAEERKSQDAGPEVIAEEFGEGSSRFLDPAAMVKLHTRHKAAPGFSKQRREKLTWAYKVLRDFLELSDNSPEAYFVLDEYTYEASPLSGCISPDP